MKLDIQLNIPATENRLSKHVQTAQRALDAKVLQDSNFYIPMNSGSLKNSGITATVIGSGKVEWSAPYAADQYYGNPNKSHQKNPNARMKWFEVAKAQKLKEWEKLANDEYNKNN